jgi:hypothetical protein
MIDIDSIRGVRDTSWTQGRITKEAMDAYTVVAEIEARRDHTIIMVSNRPTEFGNFLFGMEAYIPK